MLLAGRSEAERLVRRVYLAFFLFAAQYLFILSACAFRLVALQPFRCGAEAGTSGAEDVPTTSLVSHCAELSLVGRR